MDDLRQVFKLIRVASEATASKDQICWEMHVQQVDAYACLPALLTETLPHVESKNDCWVISP